MRVNVVKIPPNPSPKFLDNFVLKCTTIVATCRHERSGRQSGKNFGKREDFQTGETAASGTLPTAQSTASPNTGRSRFCVYAEAAREGAGVMEEYVSVLRVRKMVRAILSYLLVVTGLTVTILIFALW